MHNSAQGTQMGRDSLRGATRLLFRGLLPVPGTLQVSISSLCPDSMASVTVTLSHTPLLQAEPNRRNF